MHETNNMAVARLAQDATLSKIKSDWDRLSSLGQQGAELKIEMINIGREIGLQLQGLCGHQQIKFSFFEGIRASLPQNMTFDAAKKCVHLANNLPAPAKTLQEANRVEQMLLQAVGILEAPQRSEPQASHDTTPVTFVFQMFGTVKERFRKKFSEIEKWDDDMRAGVLAQIERHEQFLSELKAKLN